MHTRRGNGPFAPMLGLAAAVVAGAVAVAGCAPGGDTAVAEAADSSEANVRVVNVVVEPIAPTSFREYIRVTGEVAALHDVTVSAEEGGRIAAFFVEKGARLAAGARIAKIDDAVLAAQVEEARALADLTREQYERQRRLWEGDRVGSEMAYLQAKATAEQAAARLKVLQARLDRTVITAPVAGVFDEKFVEVGEMVAPATPVVRVVAVQPVKITAGVPERFALDVRPGDTVQVTLDVLPDREMGGRIGFVGTSVDVENRTLPIEIVMDNPEGLARPRMVANVRIRRRQLENVLVVPQDVLMRTEEGYQLFVATAEEGRLVARARPVTLGPSYRNSVVIAAGLQPGDSVIVVGHRQVDDRTRVRIVSTEGMGR